MHNKALKHFLPFLSYFLLSSFSFASGPYEGASSCKKSVVQPDINIDGLFEVDKDCSTIFVLPPKRGKAILASYALTGMGDLCDSYESTKKSVAETHHYIDNLYNNLKKPNLLETERNSIKQRIADANEYLEFLKDNLKEFEKMVGLRAKIHFETDWDKLVAEYRKTNPDKIVKRVPVVASVFNITTKTTNDFFDIGDNMGSSGVYSLTIPGIRLGSAQDLYEYIGLANPPEDSFLFGNSLSGALELNHHGMCSIKKFFEHNNSDMSLYEINRQLAANNIDAYLVANLSIWYPVHLQKHYKVDINVKNISSIIAKFLKTKNTFSTQEFVDEVENHISDTAVNIEIVNENVGEDTRGEIEDLKTRILDDILLKMMALIATPINGSSQIIKLEPPEDPHIYVTETRSLCRTKKRIFSRSTHCTTENYQVKQTVEGRAEAIVEKLREFSVQYTESNRQFNTILRTTTLAFTKENTL